MIFKNRIKEHETKDNKTSIMILDDDPYAKYLENYLYYCHGRRNECFLYLSVVILISRSKLFYYDI